MHELETRMGGSAENFPNTTWASLFSMTDAASAAARQEALSKIVGRYWRPVYAYVRASAGKPVEDAKDLTQAFFCHMIEDDMFAKYVRERGRFRDYLKGALRNFLAESYRSSSALKRGGGRAVVPLDTAQMETEAFGRQLREANPEEMFDRQWARDLLMEALQDLRRQLEGEGRQDQWRVYETIELSSESPVPSYEDISKRFAISTHEVKNALFAVRGRLHRILREKISSIVTSERELRDEMKHLFGSS